MMNFLKKLFNRPKLNVELIDVKDKVVIVKYDGDGDQEILTNRKPPTEAEINPLVSAGLINVPPLKVLAIQVDPGVGYDGILEVTWGRDTSRYVYEYKRQSTPKILANAISEASRTAIQMKLKPMVIVPYLNEEKLTELEQKNVSGIDLCGNAVILGDRFRVWRTGMPNWYSTSAPIKNIFRGTSSLFARCFLLQNSFPSLAKLQSFALRKSVLPWDTTVSVTMLSKGTASKVVRALEEELIVAREGEALRLIDAERLLRSLRENYVPPGARPIEAKTTLSANECWRRLLQSARSGEQRIVATGIGSSSRYAALSTENSIMIYSENAEATMTLLEANRSRTFPTLKIIETDKEIAFFDARSEGDRLWSSPIQTWIELANSGPRERDAARALELTLAQGQADKC
jgi:hypothetical protein